MDEKHYEFVIKKPRKAAVMIAKLEAENERLRDELWYGAGVAAKLEFGADHKYLDKMQTAIHYEWIQKALEKADE